MANFTCNRARLHSWWHRSQSCLSIDTVQWLGYFPTVVTGSGGGLLLTVLALELNVTENTNISFKRIDALQLANTFSVDKASNDTYVQAYKVDEGVLVVPPYEHANVRDENILEAADDGGGESGVVGSAEDGGVDQDEAKHTGEQELGGKERVRPSFKLCNIKIFL